MQSGEEERRAEQRGSNQRNASHGVAPVGSPVAPAGWSSQYWPGTPSHSCAKL